jgi:hypothetical protein
MLDRIQCRRSVDLRLMMTIPPKVAISESPAWLKKQASIKSLNKSRELKKKPYLVKSFLGEERLAL